MFRMDIFQPYYLKLIGNEFSLSNNQQVAVAILLLHLQL